MTDLTSRIDHLLTGSSPRIVLKVPLRPAAGSRFQPTGFPDLGAALYKDPTGDGERCLVESAQSMANRLEAVCWDEARDDLVGALSGLPYVRVKGDANTNSLLEAHRLNSPYVLNDEAFKQQLSELAGLGKGTVKRDAFARALLHYDPNSLVHGTFMSLIKPGTARLERMLTAFIEGEDVLVAASGGVKVDRNDTSGKDAGGSAEGFGNVPYHRNEYVARQLWAWFSLDLAGIRGLRLPESGARMVVLLALYKVRRFLDGPMRLRTACDLELDEAAEQAWSGGPELGALPQRDELEAALQTTLQACAAADLFAKPPITEVTYSTAKTTKGKRK